MKNFAHQILLLFLLITGLASDGYSTDVIERRGEAVTEVPDVDPAASTNTFAGGTEFCAPAKTAEYNEKRLKDRLNEPLADNSKFRPNHNRYQTSVAAAKSSISIHDQFLFDYSKSVIAICKIRTELSSKDLEVPAANPDKLDAKACGASGEMLNQLWQTKQKHAADFTNVVATRDLLENNFSSNREKNFTVFKTIDPTTALPANVQAQKLWPMLIKETGNVWGSKVDAADGYFNYLMSLYRKETDYVVSRHKALDQRIAAQNSILAKCRSMPGMQTILKTGPDKDFRDVDNVGFRPVGQVQPIQQIVNTPEVKLNNQQTDDSGLSGREILGYGLAGGALIGGGILISKGLKKDDDSPRYPVVAPQPAPAPYPYPYPYPSPGPGPNPPPSTTPPAGSYLGLSPAQPASAKAWLNLSNFTVTVTQPGGGIFPTNSVYITATCTQPSPCSMTSSMTVQTTNGVATFSSLRFGSSQSGAVITFSAPGLPSVSTGTFDVSP